MKKKFVLLSITILFTLLFVTNVGAAEIVGGYIHGGINQRDLIENGPYPQVSGIIDLAEWGLVYLEDEGIIEINQLRNSKFDNGNLNDIGYYIGVNTGLYENLTFTFERIRVRNEQEFYSDFDIDSDNVVLDCDMFIHTNLRSVSATIYPEINNYFSVIAGVGYYYGNTVYGLSAEARLNDDLLEDYSSRYTYDFKDNIGFRVGLNFEYPLDQGVTLNLGADYRYLKMEVDTVSDRNGELDISIDEKLDLGGTSARIGLSYAF
ncbi:outer membrane protein [Natronospora cellulosivora (SeqCode)]